MLIYAVTIFLSAMLLFQVELIVAKYILPWFGGSPAVWTTCMLFFQLALLGGYAYAHLIVSRLSPRRQGRLHLVVLAASLLLLAGQLGAWGVPLLPAPAWKPSGSSFPVLRILALLGAGVALPFFILAATSSLLQAWFSRAHPERPPWRLYALSNAGSLIGLLSYPFLIEPALPLRWQAKGWSVVYVVFAACCGWCAARLAARAARRRAPAAPAADPPPVLDPPPPEASAAYGFRIHARGDAPGRGLRWLWLALAAVPSVLLLATTNKISEEVAVVPFFWVVPLSLYLISFVVCFGGRRLYYRRAWIVLAVVAAGALVRTEMRSVMDIGVPEQTVVYCAALLACCMICHGELYKLRPSPRRLTSFYLTVAAGGAAGGALAALVAPAAFTGLWELYLGYFGCGACLTAAMLRDRRSWVNGPYRWLWRVSAIAALAGLALGAAWQMRRFYDDSVAVRRNFYGILRVKEEDADDPENHCHVLYHARTIHGLQYRDPEHRRLITSYYALRSGVGLAIEDRRSALGRLPMRIGVVGLGAGTLAAYGREGDTVRFYEINPAVVSLASGPRAFFSFLADTPARTEIVLGDARISLEREPPQQFDVLVLDAFSGDAIPIHLLTREAFAIYLRHLSADGILAVHISNRYFDLSPVAWGAAEAMDLEAAEIDYDPDDASLYSSTWVLLARAEGGSFESGEIAEADVGPPEDEPLRLWTDDYSNLLQVLK
jgi:hypothetical protein